LLGATDLPENRPRIYLDAAPVQNDSIVFAPGGGYAEKCWPLESFVALVKLLPDLNLTVIGGERDRAAGACLASTGPGVNDFTGRLSLSESFAAIAASRLVVCNSSMAMHAAAAFRKPCVVLLGAGIPSTLAHAAQWAYPETRVLAPASPEQARDHILQALAAVP